MQTLNLVDSSNVEFNAFKIFDTKDHQDNYRKLALAEQLQTTLELDALLNIFAMEAGKFVDFSGLFFKNGDVNGQMRGSKLGKKDRNFDLKINKTYIGTLSYSVNSPVSLTNYHKLKELHQLLVHPLNNAIKYQQAMQLAMEDGLTGLGNRRHFDQQLKRAMHHANRQGSNVGLMICDLNKFKLINDTHGHHIGDQILIHFAKSLKDSVRDSDSIFRFGGDEFVIIVEDAYKQALVNIERRIVESTKRDSLLAKYQTSSSIGSTLMTRADCEKSIFERADNLLYQQKLTTPNRLNIV